MRRAEIEALVDEVLRETLANSGYHHATVAERPDERGEDGFHIDVYFEPAPTAIQGLPILAVIGELRERLLERDEERFPYVHYVLGDDESLDDEPETTSV